MKVYLVKSNLTIIKKDSNFKSHRKIFSVYKGDILFLDEKFKIKRIDYYFNNRLNTLNLYDNSEYKISTYDVYIESDESNIYFLLMSSLIEDITRDYKLSKVLEGKFI